MCRIEHMYYRKSISRVIINEREKYDEIRLLLSIMQDSDEKILDSV